MGRVGIKFLALMVLKENMILLGVLKKYDGLVQRGREETFFRANKIAGMLWKMEYQMR